MLRPDRTPHASVSLLLLLVVALAVRAVRLQRLSAPRVIHDLTSAPREAEENQPPSAPRADQLSGTFLGSAASNGNVAALVSPPPADRADETPATPADAPSTTPPSSSPSYPAGAAVSSASRRQPTKPLQAPPASDAGMVNLGAAAPLLPERPEPRAERRTDLALVRVWARENGYSVADRGRVAAVVLAAYDRAH